MDRLEQPGLKTLLWLPTQFFQDFRRVHRIAPIMTRTIFHESDLFAVGAPVSSAAPLIQDVADCVDYIDIGSFAIAANIITNYVGESIGWYDS